MKSYIFAAALSLMAVACTYPFEADMEDSGDVLIVEGNITIGSYSNISVDRIIKTTGAQSTSPLSFDVRVEGEDGTYVQGTGSNPYLLDTRNLPEGQKYRLKLTSLSDNSVYLTDWTSVLGSPEVDDLKYEITGNILSFKISLHSSSNPYFQISYDEEWEYHSWVQTFYNYNDNVRNITHDTYPYYTCWNHSDYAKSTTLSAEAYEGNRLTDYPVLYLNNRDRRISVLYKIMMKVSLIPEESYRYWQNLDKISKPDGDLFSPIPSSMRGNIFKEGDKKTLVLGYVGFAASKELSLYFNNEEENFYVEPTAQIDYMLSNKKTTDLDASVWHQLYLDDYWPYDAISNDNEFGDISGYIWVTRDCVDCRRQGGTAQKPDNWGE